LKAFPTFVLPFINTNCVPKTELPVFATITWASEGKLRDNKILFRLPLSYIVYRRPESFSARGPAHFLSAVCFPDRTKLSLARARNMLSFEVSKKIFKRPEQVRKTSIRNSTASTFSALISAI
jgi:hypothetical protein